MSNRPLKKITKSLLDFDSGIFDIAIKISGVVINADQVKAGDLFIALPGAKLMAQILLIRRLPMVQ